MPLLLDERELAPLLSWDELIDLMQSTLADFSSGRTLQPVRAMLPMREHDSVFAVMPAYLPDPRAAGLKVVSVAPHNADRGMPTHLATILMLEPATGELIAILDGRLVTEMRTAAVSAAAARTLARPDSASLAILGSGVQARSHLEAFRRVRSLGRVTVWSPSLERRSAFASQESRRLGLPVQAAASAEQAVRGADLVVAATASREPVLLGEWLSPGAHVTAVGSARPESRELDGSAVRRARVFVDSAAAARVEAGDLIGAEREGGWSFDSIAGEIGAVFSGTLAGRGSREEITLFKSLGLAVEDVATGRMVVEKARAVGVGREIAV